MQIMKLFILFYLIFTFFLTNAFAESFKGYECRQDCSGHVAGYNWATKKGIKILKECEGKSESFIEGCKSWVKEAQNKKERGDAVSSSHRKE